MRHERAKRSLSAYLEGDLAGGERLRLERHLGDCAGCSSELRALERTVQLLRRLPEPEGSPDLAGAVMARLRAEPPRTDLLERARIWLEGLAPSAWPVWAAPLVVSAALAFVAVWGLQESVVRPDGAAVSVATAQRPEPQLGVRVTEPAGGAPAVEEFALQEGGGPPAVQPAAVQACVLQGHKEGFSRGPDPCLAWYASRIVSLGIDDADFFQRELRNLPPEQRFRWMSQLRNVAVRSGTAPLLAQRLHGRGSPSREIRLAGFPTR